MNKKIIFLTLILLSIFIDVKGAGIAIDGRYYNATSDIVGEGFNYNISNNTLELDGYNGSSISTLDDLNIIVNGDNYLTSNNTTPLIKAKNMVINGEGSLNINTLGTALYADSIIMKNIYVKGTSGMEFISVTNNFSLDNTKLEVDSGTTLFYGGSNNTINNTVIMSNNKWGLRYTTNSVTNIYNSDITMDCTSICINSVATLNFNNTKAFFHGKTYASANITMILDEESEFLVSYDDINYNKNSHYNNFPYLKINKIYDGNVNDNDDVDNEIYDNINDDINEDNLLGDNDNNQDTNNSPGDNDDNNSDSIKDNDSPSSDSTSNNDELNTDDNVNKPSDNIDKNDTTNDNEQDNDNSSISQDNNDKLEEDNNPNSDINDLEEGNMGTSPDDVYTNNEYENNDIYTNNEFDNYWNVEVDNPKTYDAIGYKVFLLTFSLAGIIALVFLMRYLNGKI